jgi:hypothetical protein
LLRTVAALAAGDTMIRRLVAVDAGKPIERRLEPIAIHTLILS